MRSWVSTLHAVLKHCAVADCVFKKATPFHTFSDPIRLYRSLFSLCRTNLLENPTDRRVTGSVECRRYSTSEDEKQPRDEAERSHADNAATSDDEWNVLSHGQHTDENIPPDLEAALAARDEARDVFAEEKHKMTPRVIQKCEDALRLATIHYRLNHHRFTLRETSDAIHQFSDLIPNYAYRRWTLPKCEETLVHLIQIYLEKLHASESIQPLEFSQTMKSIGKFGEPLAEIIHQSMPHDNPLRALIRLATQLIPHFTPGMITDVVLAVSNLRVFDARFLDEVILYVEINFASVNPALLASLVNALSHFRYKKLSRLVTRVSAVLIPAKSELSPRQMAHLLFAISQHRWKNATELQDALLQETHRRLDEFSTPAILVLLRYLGQARHHPGDALLRDICRKVVQQMQRPHGELIAVRTLSALAELGSPATEALSVAKQCIRSKDLPLKSALSIGWSLSTLSAFDRETVEWWVRHVDGIEHRDTHEVQKRQFYQTLMHIYVLQPEFGSYLDVDPKFEEACKAEWIEHMRRHAFTNHTTLQIFIILRELGFYCFRDYRTFGNRFSIPITLHKNLGRRIWIVCQEGFSNVSYRERGPQIWKQKMLQKLGWLIMRIPVLEWEALSTKVQKRDYIKLKLVETLDIRAVQGLGIKS